MPHCVFPKFIYLTTVQVLNPGNQHCYSINIWLNRPFPNFSNCPTNVLSRKKFFTYFRFVWDLCLTCGDLCEFAKVLGYLTKNSTLLIYIYIHIYIYITYIYIFIYTILLLWLQWNVHTDKFKIFISLNQKIKPDSGFLRAFAFSVRLFTHPFGPSPGLHLCLFKRFLKVSAMTLPLNPEWVKQRSEGFFWQSVTRKGNLVCKWVSVKLSSWWSCDPGDVTPYSCWEQVIWLLWSNCVS